MYMDTDYEMKMITDEDQINILEYMLGILDKKIVKITKQIEKL